MLDVPTTSDGYEKNYMDGGGLYNRIVGVKEIDANNLLESLGNKESLIFIKSTINMIFCAKNSFTLHNGVVEKRGNKVPSIIF